MSKTINSILDEIDDALDENGMFVESNFEYRLDELSSELDELEHDDYVDMVSDTRFNSERGRSINHATLLA